MKKLYFLQLAANSNVNMYLIGMLGNSYITSLLKPLPTCK